MNRKLWSNEEKASIVLKIIRGDESAASICNRHGVSATVVNQRNGTLFKPNTFA